MRAELWSHYCFRYAHPAEANWRARGPEDSEMKGCDELWTPIRISNHGPDLRAGSHRGGNRVEWESGMWYEGRRSREVREVGVRKQFLFLWGVVVTVAHM